ncbi:L-threonine ammonia-lyase-like [Linepithema humile]|uniref:L-threonine ammonia-lyase-like n=1 Tax=Linepithema humile TaxID=83485 RepID=UPI000622FDD4|nr:PREDICTED: threonine dehydratase biosynthetic-like [Linepithema humile]
MHHTLRNIDLYFKHEIFQYGGSSKGRGVCYALLQHLKTQTKKEDDHPNIIIGQGTLGLEIAREMPDLDAVIVPVGSGGLIAGIAVALQKTSPTTMVIGVESEMCPNFSKAREAGKPVEVPLKFCSLTDELAIPVIGHNAFYNANSLIKTMITVKEEWVEAAILKLIEDEKYVVEGSGAAGLAAISSAQLMMNRRSDRKWCIALPLCAGNLSPSTTETCI